MNLPEAYLIRPFVCAFFLDPFSLLKQSMRTWSAYPTPFIGQASAVCIVDSNRDSAVDTDVTAKADQLWNAARALYARREVSIQDVILGVLAIARSSY